MPADFDVAAVEENITATRFAGRLLHFASTGSTNQLAMAAANGGAREGVWIAEEQTAGRGRGGHAWHSAAGDGLYVSTLIAPRVRVSHAAKIPLATGLAAQAAILDSTGLAADLRWPNDLMFGDRKCGGILVESALDPRSAASKDANLRYAVIGIGINVNHRSFPDELGGVATSLWMESGRTFAREPLLASLLLYLDDELGRLEAAGPRAEDQSNIASRFAGASSWVRGKRVTVDEGVGYTGVTCGLDAHGFLLVEDGSGTIRTVLSGGVRSA